MSQLDERGLVKLPPGGCTTSPLVNQIPSKRTRKAFSSPTVHEKEKIEAFLKSLQNGPRPSEGMPSRSRPPYSQGIPKMIPPQMATVQSPTVFQLPQSALLPQQFLQLSPVLVPTVPAPPSALPQPATPSLPPNHCDILLQAVCKLLPPAPRSFYYVINGISAQTELWPLPPHMPPDWGSSHMPQLIFPSSPPPLPQSMPPPVVVPQAKSTPPATIADALSTLQSPPPMLTPPQESSSSRLPQPQQVTPSPAATGTIKRSPSVTAEPEAKRPKSLKKKKPEVIQID